MIDRKKRIVNSDYFAKKCLASIHQKKRESESIAILAEIHLVGELKKKKEPKRAIENKE